jgi:hypothetical protein
MINLGLKCKDHNLTLGHPSDLNGNIYFKSECRKLRLYSSHSTIFIQMNNLY